MNDQIIREEETRWEGGCACGEVRYQYVGKPRNSATRGGSAMHVKRGAWPTCGCPVNVEIERIPKVVGMIASNLDDPSRSVV